MNIDEYKDHGRQRYKALCQVVRQLLQQEIAADSAYRLQQVQHRAKSVDSLRKRLAETDQLDSQKIETLRKDLGGCRVIFYTNNDVNRFAQSGILSDLFDIDWERSKFHQPGPGEQNTASLFQSFNYVVSLKKERTDLVEYRDFTGLYCEVQVQTSLNHAWAEMAHDTIYKRGDLEGFGAREMETIERRLDEAMRAHLLPAGYLFQRIATDVQRIAEGKALFDDGVIDAVVDAADNNDRDEAVRRLKDDVLPHYDEVAIVFPEIREKLAKAWLLADQTDSVPHETPFGGYEGTSSDAVTAKIADILGRYRNLDLEATYQLLKELYPQTRSDESRAQLVKLAKEFASNVMQVWDKYGPHVQTELADFLSKEDDITPFAPVAIEMAEQILGSEVQGTTSSASSVTFHTGAIVYSDALAEARRRSIDTLTRYAETVTQDDGMVRLALSALLYAAQTPRRGVPSIEVERMIFSDFAYALDNIAAFIGKCSKTVRQDFESRLLQQWRWKKKLRDDQANDPGS
ncbi:MAG: RelA/SpoT domain-containing protein, partial [Pseudomonadota bacterium]